MSKSDDRAARFEAVPLTKTGKKPVSKSASAPRRPNPPAASRTQSTANRNKPVSSVSTPSRKLSFAEKAVRSLEAIGFVAFQPSSSVSTLRAQLAKVTAEVYRRYLTVLSETQWEPITHRLSVLADSATAIALRDDDGFIDICILRTANKTLPGKTWYETQEDYLVYVRKALESIDSATRTFGLSEQAMKEVQSDAAAITTAVPDEKLHPTAKQAIVSGVKLLTMLYSYQRDFRVIVVTVVSSASEKHKKAWHAQGQYTWGNHVHVEGWLAESSTGLVHGTAWWGGNHVKPSQLRSPDDLMRLLNNR